MTMHTLCCEIATSKNKWCDYFPGRHPQQDLQRFEGHRFHLRFHRRKALAIELGQVRQNGTPRPLVDGRVHDGRRSDRFMLHVARL